MYLLVVAAAMKLRIKGKHIKKSACREVRWFSKTKNNQDRHIWKGKPE
jgi:hypothetical protein